MSRPRAYVPLLVWPRLVRCTEVFCLHHLTLRKLHAGLRKKNHDLAEVALGLGSPRLSPAGRAGYRPTPAYANPRALMCSGS